MTLYLVTLSRTPVAVVMAKTQDQAKNLYVSLRYKQAGLTLQSPKHFLSIFTGWGGRVNELKPGPKQVPRVVLCV